MPHLLLLLAVICPSVARCVAASHAALRRGDLARAEKTALTGLRLAECGPETGPESDGAEVMARIALRRNEPLMARAWLGRNPANRVLAREVGAAAARLPPATGLTGRYSQDQLSGLWDEVEVTTATAERIHFTLHGVKVGERGCERPRLLAEGDLSALVLGIAEAEGDAARQGETFVYESREFVLEGERPCRLTFRFSPGALQVEQDNPGQDCGFGSFLTMAGDYVRTR